MIVTPPRRLRIAWASPIVYNGPMSITTGVGDGGFTYLLGGRKVPKTNPVIEAVGVLDELNALLGWVAAQGRASPFLKALPQIQADLFTLGAWMAAPKGSHLTLPDFDPRRVLFLEKEIQTLEKRLPVLRGFILPGGSPLGAQLHWARAVARRTERRVLNAERHTRFPAAGRIYLNRLSDYLFLLARESNRKKKKAEHPWPPKKPTNRHQMDGPVSARRT